MAQTFHCGPKKSWPLTQAAIASGKEHLFGASTETVNQYFPLQSPSLQPKYFGTIQVLDINLVYSSDVTYINYTNIKTDSYYHSGFLQQGIGGYSAFRSDSYDGDHDFTTNWGGVKFYTSYHDLSNLYIDIWFQQTIGMIASDFPDPNSPQTFSFSGHGWTHFQGTIAEWETFTGCQASRALMTSGAHEGLYRYEIESVLTRSYRKYAAVSYLSSILIV